MPRVESTEDKLKALQALSGEVPAYSLKGQRLQDTQKVAFLEFDVDAYAAKVFKAYPQATLRTDLIRSHGRAASENLLIPLSVRTKGGGIITVYLSNDKGGEQKAFYSVTSTECEAVPV